jgi:hypothetical protein
MNLLLQLLPYMVFAGIATSAVAYYVMWSSQRRRARRRPPHARTELRLQNDESTLDRFSQAQRVASAVVPPVAGKTQILRLRELGISEGHIAAALQLPLEEVHIVVHLERVRRPLTAPAEIPQPSIVE